MFKEIDLLLEIKKNIENSLGNISLMIKASMESILDNTSFKDEDSFAMLPILRNTSKKIEQNSLCKDMDSKEKLRVETYLDILYCLLVHKKRKFKAEDVEECKKMINGNYILNPYFKDLALLCCEVENIMHNYDLASYRSYKKYFCDRIGL